MAFFRMVSSSLLLAELIVGLILSIAGSVFLVAGEYQVTNALTYDTNPRMGNDGISNIVVYNSHHLITGNGFDQSDIWYQRLDDKGAAMGSPVHVTSDPTDDELVDISGDYIVYTAYASIYSMSGRVMLYQISTEALYILGSAVVMREPRICGDWVVWCEGATASGQIMYYDLAWLGTGDIAEVLAGPAPPTYSVDIGERFVVWSERVGTNYDIVAYDRFAEQRVQVTATGDLSETEASTWEEWIVWEEQQIGVPQSPIRIMAKNMETAEERCVASNGAQNYRPSIEGDTICYESTINENYDIFCYRLSTGQTFQVTSNLGDQYLNDVFGNFVAYVDSRYGDEDIFVESLPPSSVVEWWPTFHHCETHVGYSISTAPNENNTLWTYTTGGSTLSSSAVLDDKLYAGSSDNKVYCLNASTGIQIWEFTTGYEIESSPTVMKDKVYVGSNDDRLYCLNTSNGACIWNYSTGGDVMSSPNVHWGRVYVGSQDSRVYCLDTVSGAQSWNYTTGGPVYSSPTVFSIRVYVGSTDGKVYCLDYDDGTSVWNYTTGGSVFSSPASAYDRDTSAYDSVFVGSYDGKIYCLNSSSGEHIWNYTTGGPVISSPAVENGKVYVGSTFDMKIYCLNASTGEHIWNFTTGGEVQSSPAVADGKVYVGSYDNKLYCLNASTGNLIWSYLTGSAVFSSPAVADGKVYVGSYDKKVYAFGPVHDVAAKDLKPYKKVVGQSFNCSISTTVANEGSFREAFNVTVNANAQGIDQELAGYWSLDEGRGTTARDRSEYQHHGRFSTEKVWQWQTTGYTEGWMPGIQVEDFRCDGTSLRGMTSGSNPNIDSPSSLNVVAAQARTIRLRMNITTTSTPARIYFITNDEPIWDAAKSKFFYLQDAGQWVEYTIDMSTVSEWAGTVSQIRLVPCQTDDATFNIDWLVIGISLNWTEGKWGPALLFNGVENGISAPFIPLQDQSFTVTMWFNAKSLPNFPTDAPLLSQSDTPETGRYLHLVIRNGFAYFGFYEDDLEGATMIGPNTWYHIAFIYNYTNNHKYIYLNGTLDASGPSSAAYKGVSGDTLIGATQDASFNGTIDEVRIYSRALTQQEIEAVASSGAIETQTITVEGHAFTNVTFTWNTIGFSYGNYAISVYAWPVSDEDHTVDNLLTDGFVKIGIPGDINGDTVVDSTDLGILGGAWGSFKEDPNYIPEADINDDSVVDSTDLGIMGGHWGEIE